MRWLGCVVIHLLCSSVGRALQLLADQESSRVQTRSVWVSTCVTGLFARILGNHERISYRRPFYEYLYLEGIRLISARKRPSHANFQGVQIFRLQTE